MSATRGARRRLARLEAKEPPVIVDVLEVAMDYDGTPCIEPLERGGDPQPVRLQRLIWQALNFPIVGDQPSGDFTYRCFKITKRVHPDLADDVEECKVKLAEKDITFILDRSGRVNSALAHGRLTEMLGRADDDDDEAGDEATG